MFDLKAHLDEQITGGTPKKVKLKFFLMHWKPLNVIMVKVII
jgi:hypothetical protein